MADWAPTNAEAPITTSSPSFAPDSMMAVGWICFAMASVESAVIDRGEHQIGGADDLAGDAALALRAGHGAPNLGQLDLDRQLVAGADGLAPLHLVAAHEQSGL